MYGDLPSMDECEGGDYRWFPREFGQIKMIFVLYALARDMDGWLKK